MIPDNVELSRTPFNLHNNVIDTDMVNACYRYIHKPGGLNNRNVQIARGAIGALTFATGAIDDGSATWPAVCEKVAEGVNAFVTARRTAEKNARDAVFGSDISYNNIAWGSNTLTLFTGIQTLEGIMQPRYKSMVMQQADLETSSWGLDLATFLGCCCATTIENEKLTITNQMAIQLVTSFWGVPPIYPRNPFKVAINNKYNTTALPIKYRSRLELGPSNRKYRKRISTRRRQ